MAMAESVAVHTPSGDWEELAKVFTGTLGIEENLIAKLGNLDGKKRQLFRRATPDHFHFNQDRHFELWHGVHKFQIECARFQVAVTLWTMDQAERDARWVHDVLRPQDTRFVHHLLTQGGSLDHVYDALSCVTHDKPLSMVIEVACSRTSEELLKARHAYHSLFKHSMEEDLPRDKPRKFLAALLSAYRYEGIEVDMKLAEEEAEIFRAAIKKKPQDPIDKDALLHDDNLVHIISTRSKERLKATFDYYHRTYKNPIYEDIGKGEDCLRATILCLCFPAIYYSEILKKAMKDGEHEEAITRVIVTRAETDMKEIKEAYFKENKVRLEDDIEKKTRGNYRDFLLTLLGRDRSIWFYIMAVILRLISLVENWINLKLFM